MFKQSAVLILTTFCTQPAFHSRSLHFTPGLQSAVCSPQSSFYTDRYHVQWIKTVNKMYTQTNEAPLK